MSDYFLTDKIGNGKIGVVYKAVNSVMSDTLACKVIASDKLKDGWERELEKVLKLRGVPNVVPFHQYGSGLDKRKKTFVWIMWDYIPSMNLRDYLEELPWPLDMAFIESITKTTLQVLHACQSVGIQHGDLHEGNILISDPDLRLIGNPRTIWISDFGYGGSHNQKEPKNDFRQLFSITSNLLARLRPSSLNPRDKVLHGKIQEFLNKRLLEIDVTQGGYAGVPEKLLKDFLALGPAAERESAAATKGEELKDPSDFLVAEALGYRVEEWKNLFVPEFLAAQDLLSKNITILTGARGCGKTMTFRRLTKYMDMVIGEPSGVQGADQFVGFYLNCRNLVEAFPWLPHRRNIAGEQQILHYFHLAWFSEILTTLAECDSETLEPFQWLDSLLARVFPGSYVSLPVGASILSHAGDFIEREKERCRLTNLGSKDELNKWQLARPDFLDILQTELESNVAWIGKKPLFMFLDDYTIPIVTREVQQMLNPIIFKRRSKLFFKVSTEAANSFDRTGLRGKPLELHQDFELIDLANESLHQDDQSKAALLDKIFKPRIDRHPALRGKGLNLVDILGSMSVSNNKLALQMRNTSSRVVYHGADAFMGMWSSDIRIMIQMFSDILREANGSLRKGATVIDKAIQDKIYRTSGGEFLIFTDLLNKPSFWERGPNTSQPGESYGKHLHDIAEAFIQISRYELTRGELVTNQGQQNPKQAFRLEIIDKFELPYDVLDYYEGLVRWHIFLQDWRGKSIRGMITPRLYLNRILIPYSNLTFSTHDSLSFSNEKFIELLRTPKKLQSSWEVDSLKKMKQSTMQTGLWDKSMDKESA